MQPTSRAILQTALGIAGQDRFPIGLAAVDHNLLGSAIPVESLAQEPFDGGGFAARCTKLNRVAVALGSGEGPGCPIWLRSSGALP